MSDTSSGDGRDGLAGATWPGNGGHQDSTYTQHISTASTPAMEPKATAIGITARWPLENNLNV